MWSRILTPDSSLPLYLTTGFILMALSSQAIAGLLHARWLIKKSIKIMTVSTVFKLMLVIWGFCIVPLNAVFIFSSWWPADIMIGCMAGLLLVRWEEWVVRFYARSQLLKNTRVRHSNHLGSLLSNAVLKPTPLQLSSTTNTQRESGLRQSSNNLAAHDGPYHFIFFPLLLTAVFEEILFRGLLFWLAWQCPAKFSIAMGLVLSSLMFSFSHINFGGLQLALKIIFSLCMLLIATLTGSLLAPISAHVLFNIIVWQKLKGQAMLNLKHTPSQISIVG